MRLPDGTEEVVETGDPTNLAWGPVRRAGLYELSWEEPGSTARERRTFAVNQLDEVERRIDAAESIDFSVDVIDGSAARAGGTRWQDFWPWILGASLVLMLIEWWIWQRQSAAG